MSRIAVQGDPGGLGIVTIKAPNTEDSYALELPPSGGILARASSGGMPLLDDGTPVVESGSNSDGEWTRWADGTQRISVEMAAGLPGPSGTSIDYPMPFRSGDSPAISPMLHGSTSMNPRAFRASDALKARNIGVSLYAYDLSGSNVGVPAGETTLVSAHGYYK